ncbi:MAG TPA: phosphatase PAP2 family protein [Kribbella sp.]
MGTQALEQVERVRWTMVSVTGLALVGHIMFPLAPPRMLPQPGFVDTGLESGHSVYGPRNSGGVANQFAAMPSLHVGIGLPVLLRPGLRDDPPTLRNSFSRRRVLK